MLVVEGATVYDRMRGLRVRANVKLKVKKWLHLETRTTPEETKESIHRHLKEEVKGLFTATNFLSLVILVELVFSGRGRNHSLRDFRKVSHAENDHIYDESMEKYGSNRYFSVFQLCGRQFNKEALAAGKVKFPTS